MTFESIFLAYTIDIDYRQEAGILYVMSYTTIVGNGGFHETKEIGAGNNYF